MSITLSVVCLVLVLLLCRMAGRARLAHEAYLFVVRDNAALQIRELEYIERIDALETELEAERLRREP